ncbi:MAG: DUF2845 domain-containing protein [Ectothiorhodospiraceae bacterium]|jgi:hypothetical protein
MRLMTAVMLIAVGVFCRDAMALRCPDGLVEMGDRRFQVRHACGDPDYVDRQAEAFVAGVGVVGEIVEWYYNPGPQKLVRILTFRNGRLVKEETGGRGFSRIVSGSCSPNDIQPGMSKFELRVRCGPPDHRESHFSLGVPRDDMGWRFAPTSRVDEWVYNFGSRHFLRFVRIVDGRVTSVELGDRGY